MQRQKVDALFHNGKVYTAVIDLQNSPSRGAPVTQIAEAFAIKKGRFVAVGSSEEILAQYTAKQTIDLESAVVMPGLIDAHCHFLHYGRGLQWANLKEATTRAEMLEAATTIASATTPGKWVRGRGWKESNWEDQRLPTLEELDQAFPEHPVYLVRIDGHAAFANSLALKQAGINEAGEIAGGKISGEGKPDGLLIDSAMELVRKKFPAETTEDHQQALLAAQRDCFAVGLTSIHDAGLSKSDYGLIDALHKARALLMPIYGMLTPDAETTKHFRAHGPYRTEKLNLRSFKYYADGALGSRGARLIDDYTDDPGNKGILMHEQAYLREQAALNAAQGFQMCTHAIGDAANQLMLDIYSKALAKARLNGKDHRWRIEHAQLVQPEDQKRFGKLGVLPSIQATHATSDMGWVGDRLGEDRLASIGYPYKSLWESTLKFNKHGCLPGGSDFPIEHVNPLYGFHAAVARQDHEGKPEGGFLPTQGLSREMALLSMTHWAAMAGFEEDDRGSIAPGKSADFVLPDRDIMECPPGEIPSTQIKETWLAGKAVYKRTVHV